jgi:hypothetical protein
LEDIDIDWKIILEWIFGKEVRNVWSTSCGSGYGPVAGSCEHGNELSGSIKGEKLLDQLCDY